MARHKMFDAQQIVDSMASASIRLSEPMSDFTIDAKYVDANASISALSIVLQHTPDGLATADADADWRDITTHAFTGAEITALKATWHIVEKLLGRVRVKVSVSTGEGTGDLLTCILTIEDNK